MIASGRQASPARTDGRAGSGRIGSIPAATTLAAGLLLIAAALPGFGPARAQVQQAEEAPVALKLETHPITSFSRLWGSARVGDLEFLGGLELSASASDFGGLSGIATADKGRDLLMITDGGFWVSGRLDTAQDGTPRSLSAVTMADMHEASGKALIDKRDADTESLAIRRTPDGLEAIVGFEARHRILRFPFAGPGLAGALASRGSLLPATPKDVRTLRYTKGLEAIAVAPAGSPLAGALVAISEAPRRGETRSRGWIIGGPRPGALEVALNGDYEITDAAFLPGGDLLLLERRFEPPLGVGARIRRIAGDTIAPGGKLDGRIIFEAGLTEQIDNMEGLAVDTSPDGRTILTLVSDDNHSILQRTLLLRFRLVEPGG